MLNTWPNRLAVRLGRQQIGLDHVVDEAEIPRLLAVAEDHRLPLGERRRDEARNHGRVLRAGILPRPEDVEVAEHHRLDPERCGRTSGGTARRPASTPRRANSGSGDMVSTFGSIGVSPYAEETRRRPPGHAQARAASSTRRVPVALASWLGTGAGQRPGHRRERGLVEDHFPTVGGRRSVAVEDAALDHLDVIRQIRQVLPPTRREVVEHADRPPREQRARERRTDESRPASHQHVTSHGLFSPPAAPDGIAGVRRRSPRQASSPR